MLVRLFCVCNCLQKHQQQPPKKLQSNYNKHVHVCEVRLGPATSRVYPPPSCCSILPCSLCLFKPFLLYLLLYPPPTIIPVFYRFLCPHPPTLHHLGPLLLYLLLYLFLLKSHSSSFASRPGRAELLFLGFY